MNGRKLRMAYRRAVAENNAMLKALNANPVRYLDYEGTIEVHPGDPRYEDAPFEKAFIPLLHVLSEELETSE